MRRPAPGAATEPASEPAAAPLSVTAETERASGRPAPAPWSLVSASQVDGRGDFHLYVADANGRKIAAIWTRGEEKLATGYLMEAAPDMLAALKKIIAEVAQSPDIRLGSLFEADAAIAKAEGRTS